VVCYNNIIMVHHRVRELWYNSHTHTMGPQVDKTLSKLLTVFPKLTSLRVEDVVNFYDRLQEVSMKYAIALMPFDAVVLLSFLIDLRDFALRAWASFVMLPCARP
jgi:hypothetical protein